MRTAVVGVGSIGTIVGALIAKKGANVELIDNHQTRVNVLNEKGATIVGSYILNVPVKALTSNEMSGIYDLVLLLTKQTANAEVLPALLPYINENSLVITLQNGIPEEGVAEIIGRERTAGGSIGWGATWIEPGKSMLTSSRYVIENYAFDIGELDGKDTLRIRQAQKLLSLVGTTHIVDNLMGVKWAKLLMNATFSGMSAALGSTFGDVLNDNTTIQCIAFIADETIRVANALGVRLAKMQGRDFEYLKLKGKSDISDKLQFYHDVWDQHANLKASMLQDLEKNRKTEIDYINGFVSKKGAEVGIATPFNDKVLEMVRMEEETGIINTINDKSSFLPLLSSMK